MQNRSIVLSLQLKFSGSPLNVTPEAFVCEPRSFLLALWVSTSRAEAANWPWVFLKRLQILSCSVSCFNGSQIPVQSVCLR